MMKVYKLVRKNKDGEYHPLFIEKDREFKLGEWFDAHFKPTKGFAPRSINGVNVENPIGGVHACFQPLAPHLKEELSNGEKRVWLECYAKGKTQTYDRPISQGGAWILVESVQPIRELTSEDVEDILHKQHFIKCEKINTEV